MKPFSLSIRRQETPVQNNVVEVSPESNKSVPALPSLKRQATSELLENMPSGKTPKTPAGSFRPISAVSPTLASPLSTVNISPIPPMEGFRISPHSNTYRSNVYFSPTTVRKIVPQTGKIGVETKREIALYQYLQGKDGADKYLAPYIASTNASLVNTANSIFLNMGLLEGSDMIDYVNENRGTLSLADRKDLIIKTAEALRWYAEQGFLHGDIKFDNLFREMNGNIRLIDLGQTVSVGEVTQLPYGGSTRMVRIDVARVGNVSKEMYVFVDKIIYELLSNDEITTELFQFVAMAPDRIGRDLKKTMIDFYTTIITLLQKPQEGGRRYRRRSQKVHRRIRKTHRKNRRHQ